MAQPPQWYEDLHGQLGHFCGVPVFEDKALRQSIVVDVPVPGTGYRRPKIIVPSWHEFENELWIETTLHRVVEEQMGDTLEWLYGKRTWVSPTSRYSVLILRLTLKQFQTTVHNTAIDLSTYFRDVFAPAVREASRAVDGLFRQHSAYGYMPPAVALGTPDAKEQLKTIIASGI